MSASEQVWTRYWSTAGKAGSGCLPNAAGAVESAQRQAWEEFARRLPRRARLLDLATGDGIVLRRIAAVRRDLTLIGVDSAKSLPDPPKGIRLRGSVSIEALPFADRSFDAATSQFGIEYGDAAAAAAELARVLKPGSAILFVIHHKESILLRHNLARLAALRWAAGPEGLVAKARRFAAASPHLPVPPLFRQAHEEARRLYPDQPVAAEIATGLLQRLTSRRGDAAALVEALQAEASGEIARIELLARAALDEAGIGALAEILHAAGFALDPPEPLWTAHSSVPLAWRVEGRLSGRGTSR